MVRNYLSTLVKTVASYFLLELSSCIKFSFILGSKRLFFSGVNIAGPLLGHYNGLSSFLLMVLRRKFLLNSALSNLGSFFVKGLLNPLVYYIPTIIASGYWFSSNMFVRLAIPLICMALFIVHPIGNEAFLYSLYWFIPMIIHFLPVQRVFTEALGTTFLAHAIGSVLMLYSMPMAAEYWLRLIPLVVIERLLFASGMTIVLYGAQWCAQLWSSYKHTITGIPCITKRI